MPWDADVDYDPETVNPSEMNPTEVMDQAVKEALWHSKQARSCPCRGHVRTT